MSIQERREREKEDLRRKIILAASELISRNGHENLTIRKLAAAVEYSPRTIYLYFRDKEELLREVIEEGFRRTLELREREHGGGNTLERRLRDHIASAFENPNFYRAVVTLLLEKNFEPGPAQLEIIRQTREDLVQTGAGEETALSMVLFSTLRGFTLSLLNMSGRLSPREREELIDRYIQFAKRGTGT